LLYRRGKLSTSDDQIDSFSALDFSSLFTTTLPPPPVPEDLEEAIKNGEVDKVRELLASSDLNRIQFKVANVSMKHFNEEIFDLVLEKIDINILDDINQTLLYFASYYGHYEGVRAMIKKAPYMINRSGKDHMYPIHAAANHGHCKVVSLLIDNGAEVNVMAINPGDELSDATPTVTPLNMATRANNTECVKVLLNGGADPNILDYLGQLPSLSHPFGIMWRQWRLYLTLEHK
jgi:ankyrin repeat protein